MQKMSFQQAERETPLLINIDFIFAHVSEPYKN